MYVELKLLCLFTDISKQFSFIISECIAEKNYTMNNDAELRSVIRFNVTCKNSYDQLPDLYTLQSHQNMSNLFWIPRNLTGRTQPYIRLDNSLAGLTGSFVVSRQVVFFHITFKHNLSYMG